MTESNKDNFKTLMGFSIKILELAIHVNSPSSSVVDSGEAWFVQQGKQWTEVRILIIAWLFFRVKVYLNGVELSQDDELKVHKF